MLGMNELPNVRKHRNLEEYNSTSYMGAAFEQSWTEAPLDSIWRDRELRLANVGQGEVKYTYTNPLMGRDIEVTETKPKKRLSTDEAKEQIKQTGLPLSVPEASYTQKALDIIIERKQSELLRKDQMDRAKGIVPAVGQFTAMLAAQVVDPINVAASFVPVVGPARYTAMMAKATTAGARALTRLKVGAVEGVAGAAIVEPFVYRATQREQADYTMYDSMLNIGLGAVMGAGLHAGFGAVGDLIRKGVRPDVATATVKPTGETPRFVANAAPETREAMFKSSIAQELEGRPTNVEAVGNFDNKLNKVDLDISEVAIKSRADALGFNTKDVFYHGTSGAFDEFKIGAAMGAGKVNESVPTDAVFLTSSESTASAYAYRAGKKVDEEFYDPVGAGGKISEGANVIPVYAKMENPLFVFDKMSQKLDQPEIDARLIEARDNGHDSVVWMDAKDTPVAPFGSIDTQSTVVAILDPSGVRSKFDSFSDLSVPKTTDTNQTLENTIRDNVKRGSDPEASLQADAVTSKPETTVDDELEFATESVQNLERVTGIKGDDLSEFDNAILKAEEDAKALEAAVMCRLTK